MKKPLGDRRGFLISLVLLPFLAAALITLAIIGWGYYSYKKNETSIIRKMDQYFLAITQPDREEYRLEGDEVFEVPYMASRLTQDAAPTRIYDRTGRLIGEFSSAQGLYVQSPDELPGFLKKALVATEDGNFYTHHGVNYRAMGRAMLVNLRTLSKRQGGSTLTQQLAKLLFTTRKKTYGRKVFELFCARKLEEKFTKDQLLLMYLDFAYFGHGAFGVESASRFYFDKSARALQLEEAAMLVGIIASPNKYSPIENPELARARQRTVLTRMARLGFIPMASVERYHAQFWRGWEERPNTREVSFWRMKTNESPYLVEHVRRRLEKDFSKERILKGGLRVQTTFDLQAQKAAEAALQEALREENRKSTTAASRVEGALAAIDPTDGAILALVGGSGFNFKNQLDRSTNISRPIGSSVKPFVYAAAFESGRFKPEDEIEDAQPVFHLPGGKTWKPANYGDKYYGKVTLRFALHKSINSVAIRLLESAGIDRVITLLSEATGRPKEHFPRNLTLALGTAELSPLELASAYAVFANDGRPVRPHFLLGVEDRNGLPVSADEKETEEAAPEPSTGTVLAAALSSTTCRTLIDVMRGVLGPEGSAYGAAQKTGFNLPAAGKTGTTNDYRDAWFAGITPDIAAAVWVGHDDMRIPLTTGRTGGGVAAPAWMQFVRSFYRNRPVREFFQ
ncbi:MAG: PBP1A family penicillin-binding protein [Elusimicrobiota bacterium]|jgi:penicillin-binding protein 1A